MPQKQPTLIDLARMVHALTQQLAVTESRVKALEKLLSSPARAKSERLPPEEWVARRRKVIKATNEKRWGTKTPEPKKTRKSR